MKSSLSAWVLKNLAVVALVFLAMASMSYSATTHVETDRVTADYMDGNQTWEHQSYPACSSTGYAVTCLGDIVTATYFNIDGYNWMASFNAWNNALYNASQVNTTDLNVSDTATVGTIKATYIEGGTWTDSQSAGNHDLTGVDEFNVSEINRIVYVDAGNGTDLVTQIEAGANTKVIVPYGEYDMVNYSTLLPSNIQIVGVGFPTLKVNQTDRAINFMTFHSGKNIEFTGFIVEDISGMAKSFLYTGGNARNVHIHNNQFYNFTFGYVVFIRGAHPENGLSDFSEEIYVYNNVFNQKYVKNTSYEPRAIYFDGGTKKSRAFNNIIYGQTGDVGRCIEFDGDYTPTNWGEENKAYNNEIKNCHIGMMLENQKKSSFYNNDIYDCWRGIYLYSSLIDVEIKNNYIYNTTAQAGIHYEQSGSYSLGNPKNINIEDNFIWTTTNNAILIEEPDNASMDRQNITIKGNTIYNRGRTPINLCASCYGVATDNIILDALNRGSYGGVELQSVNFKGSYYFSDITSSVLYDYSNQGESLVMNFNNGSIDSNGDPLDSSTENHHGTNNGATHSSTAGFNGGGAYEFDGSTNYIKVGDGSDYSDLCVNGCTFRAWAKKIDANHNDAIIGRSDATGDNNFFLLLLDSDEDTQFYISHNGTTGAKCSIDYTSSDISVDVFYHYVGVFNTTHVLLYRDGVLLESQSCGFTGVNETAWDDSEDTFIGVHDDGSFYNEFKGTIDNVIMSRRIWSADDILEDYRKQTESLNSFVSQKDILVNSSGIYPQNNLDFLGSYGILNIATFTASANLDIGAYEFEADNLTTGLLVKITTNATAVYCNANEEGNIYFNTGTNKHYGCDGTNWNALY